MMRVLQVVSVMDVGGMESYIMNLYRNLDRTQIQFDFLVHHSRRGVFEDEIEALGGHVFHTSLMDDFNLPKYLKALNRLFDEHSYSVVHGHLGSTAFFYLGAAKRKGVKARILHSHCPGHPNTVKGYVKDFLFHFSPIYANVRLACSEPAGRYQFHKRDFEVVPNGIDVQRFRFNPQLRAEMRRKMGLEDAFVIGHVGRFYYEKNHLFLIRAFYEYHKSNQNAVLLLLGDGTLMEEATALVKKLDLENSVRFEGLVSDTAPYYQAMDVFAMPSLYEALPLAGIEAQCASLPCLFSQGVSQETRLSKNAAFLPASYGDEKCWAQKFEEICAAPTKRSGEFSEALNRFDAVRNAKNMAIRYQNLSRPSV